MSQYSQAQKHYNTQLKEHLGKMYKYIPLNATVLDVGCSTGYFGEMLINDKKSKVDGIEYNNEDAKIAKKVLNNVYSFDLDSEIWPKDLLKNKYDVIFFGDVLEHLKDTKKVLEKFIKLLNKEGKVVISIPNIAHASIRLELLTGNFEYEKLGILDETHLKYFTFKSFSRLLNEAGYKILAHDQSTVLLPKNTINTIINKLGLSARKKFYEVMNMPDATAFQYKFVATPGKSTKTPSLPAKPLARANRDEQTIEELNQKIRYLERELSDMQNSRSWKLTKPLRKASSISKKNK